MGKLNKRYTRSPCTLFFFFEISCESTLVQNKMIHVVFKKNTKYINCSIPLFGHSVSSLILVVVVVGGMRGGGKGYNEP